MDGVDILFVGTEDLSLQSGIPGQFDHELTQEAIRKTAKAAKKAGKYWGCPSGSIKQTQELLEMGARLIGCNADIVMIKNGLEKMQSDMSPLGFTFNNQLSLARQ